MLLQILTVDYFLNNGKPVIRIFGKTEEGKSVCCFYNDFLPYFYVSGNKERILKKLKDLKLDYEEVMRFLPFGYQEFPKKMIKVILSNPQDIPKIRDTLINEKIVDECYEADILFKYRFMVDFGLKGMQWIDVDARKIFTKGLKVPTYEIKKIKKIEKKENAPLKYLSIDIECLPLDTSRVMDAKKDPIIIIALAFEPSFKNRKTIVLHTKNAIKNEKEMLEEFLRIVDEYDPDIISGYNCNTFDIPYILERLRKYNLPQNLGRCDKPVFSRTFGTTQEHVITGRIVADSYRILRGDPNVRLYRYSLAVVAKELLGEEKEDIEYGEIPNIWATDTKRLIDYARKDAELSLRLITEKRLLDRFFELSKISGLLLQDCFGGQASRIENMLLYEFKKRNFVMPSRPLRRELFKRTDKIKGATVLEPRKGLYKNIIVLDFTSLYPFIIKNFNISPDSLLIDGGKYKYHESPDGTKFIAGKYEGIFPAVIKELLNTRLEAKKAMKFAKGEERRILDARQNALKTLANSMYGYCAYARARLYKSEIANAITAYGRKNIEETKRMVEEKFPVEIIYADTDSLFIKTNVDLEAANKLGEEISKFVSEKSGFLFEFEKIYKTFLILTKKRYAGWLADGTIEMRGIETVRRDWCQLVTEVMNNVIEIILKEGNVQKAIDEVRHVINKLSNDEIPLEKLTIIKGITKSLDSYEGMLPHIELAKKIAKRSPLKTPKVGDRLGFVIVRGSELLSKRAEDPNYVRKNKLQIDSEYYINSQLLPPVERIFHALGITKNELIGNGKQVSISDIFRKEKTRIDREKDFFTCKKCNKSYRRIPLRGLCECGGEIT